MPDYEPLIRWIESLDRSWLFIGILPFVALVVGLWSKYANSKKDKWEGHG